MKIIGYSLKDIYENGRVIETKKYLMIVECCGLEIKEYDDDGLDDGSREENNYRVYMRCNHPSENYFIIGSQMIENKYYRWLTLKEAEKIVESAIMSDVIDLRKFGDYHICYEGRIQTVMIMNEYDEFDDEPVPIVIKTID